MFVLLLLSLVPNPNQAREIAEGGERESFRLPIESLYYGCYVRSAATKIIIMTHENWAEHARLQRGNKRVYKCVYMCKRAREGEGGRG